MPLPLLVHLCGFTCVSAGILYDFSFVVNGKRRFYPSCIFKILRMKQEIPNGHNPHLCILTVRGPFLSLKRWGHLLVDIPQLSLLPLPYKSFGFAQGPITSPGLRPCKGGTSQLNTTPMWRATSPNCLDLARRPKPSTRPFLGNPLR